MDHGTLPPDLRRRDRHHVLRDRLRYLASSHWTSPLEPAAHASAIVAVVHRHDGYDVSLALGRHPWHAAPHGLFRLYESRARRRCVLGHAFGRGRTYPGCLRNP